MSAESSADHLGGLKDYVRIRAKIAITPDGCWVNRDLTVNRDYQPVAKVNGKTVAVRTWLRMWFGVTKERLVPCDTKGCLCPLHRPSRKPVALAI